MIRLAVIAALVCMAQPAAALSCLPYWVQDSWHDAVAASERYIVVAGEFALDQPVRHRPPDVSEPNADPITVRAQFDAQIIAGGGGETRLEGTATLTFGCIAAWCAGAPDGPMLVFLREDGPGQYSSETGPCGGFIYADRPQTRAMIRACAAGGTCLSASDAMGN